METLTETPTPVPTPTERKRPTAEPGTPGSPTPTMTRAPKATPNGTTDVVVSLDNRDDRTYRVFLAVVRDGFDGATVTYVDGSSESFPDVSTARELRRANNDSRVADITFEGTAAASALVTAGAGVNTTTTLADAPADATLVYFLYTEPFDPTRSTTDVIVCDSGTLGPVTFTIESGSQQFEPGCFQGTPTR